MKYKLWGISAWIAVILLCIFIPSLSGNAEKERYQQHLEAEPKAVCSHGEEVFCTHLPLVEIDTEGQMIPGKNIVDDLGKIVGQETTLDGQDEIFGKITIVDNEKTNSHMDDKPALESRMKIHIRGNSSRSFDKTNFSIRLTDENGESQPQSVMGMDEHHEWVLHGPFLDKTLMRNYMWYNLAGKVMDYAPNVRFCEVFVNGEYQGVYVMTESITSGEGKSRLDFSVDKKDNTFTGYLLRLDRGSENEMKNIGTFSQYSRRTNLQLNIVYPGTKKLTPELKDAIQQDFSYFEKTLYSYDYDNDKYGYEQMIDVDSFVDYFLINELACNYDAGWLSTYIYKGIDGKFRMCIWDFNSACNNYQEQIMSTDGFQMQDCLWYFMLTKDEDFTDRIVERYWELRKTYFDEEYLDNYIDDVAVYLGDAIDRNYEKWGYTFQPEYDLLEPANRNPRSYEEAISDMKEFLHERIQWMDENIETVRQYSSESRIKKFNENAN
ncbi:CotH kinase family protein [Sporofaciens sp. SGI.106]|uniref:CotH kinase family protein n=1 Tax=Sporofaciens sp. SGI.106 TaxID=3420568 RepID=UPI003D05F105